MLYSAKRLYDIFHTVLYYGLDRELPKSGLFRWLRLAARLHPTHYRRNHEDLGFGARLRLTFEALGPIFVKLGQTLSTRPDLIPADIIDELSKLQDRVPPFSGRIAREIIESALGEPVEAVFADFENDALASASVAQVHGAKLYSGEEVVVKVLRPEVWKKVARDIKLMYVLAGFAAKTREGRRLRPIEVVGEFERTMKNELDLMNEAASVSQVKANFADSKILHVPKVYWPYCRSKVMVQERIFYLNISDQETLEEAGVDKKKLAERGVEIFFTQVFRDSFFHADMHPGNVFVDIDDPEDPKYCAIDFGIMGALNPEDQHYLAENFLAFFNRDYRRVAELHVESGWVPARTRISDFETAIRKVSEPIFGRPIKDISFGVFLLNLFQTARQFDMQIQPQLVLLQKTFFNVEGLGRRLYPELDLWTTAKPVLENWMKQQVGVKAAFKRMRDNAHEYARSMPKMPIVTYRLLERELKNPGSLYRRGADNHGQSMQTLAGALLFIAALSLWLMVQPDNWAQRFALVATGLLGLALLFRKKNDRYQ